MPKRDRSGENDIFGSPIRRRRNSEVDLLRQVLDEAGFVSDGDDVNNVNTEVVVNSSDNGDNELQRLLEENNQYSLSRSVSGTRFYNNSKFG